MLRVILLISLLINAAIADEQPQNKVTACEDTKHGKICLVVEVHQERSDFTISVTFKDKKLFSTDLSTTDPAPFELPLNSLLKLKLYIYDITLNPAEKKGSFKSRGELIARFVKKPIGRFSIGEFDFENGKIKFHKN